MASLLIRFNQVSAPLEGTTYPHVTTIKSVCVVGKKMPMSWVHKNYGKDCNDNYYFIRKSKSNPYGEMWVSYNEGKYDWYWDVCQLYPKKYGEICDKAYNKIVVTNI